MGAGLRLGSARNHSFRPSIAMEHTPLCLLEAKIEKRLFSLRLSQCISYGEVYLDLSFIALILPFTSFFTSVIGIGLSIGKLTMAFVVG